VQRGEFAVITGGVDWEEEAAPLHRVGGRGGGQASPGDRSNCGDYSDKNEGGTEVTGSDDFVRGLICSGAEVTGRGGA